MFDPRLFNELLRSLYTIKANNLYVRAQWKTDGELALKTKGLLEGIATKDLRRALRPYSTENKRTLEDV